MSLLFQWKCFVVFRYKQNYERMYQLKEWQSCGGVMVLGYDMFRNLTNPKAARIRKKAIETFQSALIDPGEIVFICRCCMFWVNVTHSLGVHVTLNGPRVHVCVCLPVCMCTHVSLHRHAHVSHSLSKNYACVQYNSPTVHLILILDLTLTFPHYIFLPFSLAQVRGSHEITRLVK
jgi:hypothetical protein